MTRASLSILAFWFVACQSQRPMPAAPSQPETVQITAIAEGVWVHTAFKDLPEIGPFPTNGLIVKTSEGVYLIDTAWNDAQTEEILRWVKSNLHVPIKFAIVTHAHDDKMGGVAALHRAGVETYAYAETNAAAPGRGLVPAKHSLRFASASETFAHGEIEAFYPGAGHTADNIVVYVRQSHVLFGGCLLRAEASPSLGNIEHADLGHWDAAVASVKARYPDSHIVVPSHSPPGTAGILDHTIGLVSERRAAAARE